MNDVEALPQMKWACARRCYGFAVNEVALRANGHAVTRDFEAKRLKCLQLCGY